MKKIGIIVNPNSRKNQRNNLNSIKKFSIIGGDYVDVRATKDIDELKSVILTFKDREYEYIGISGGDGTIHKVITEIINIYKPSPIPPILLLSDGTMNNIASSIGLNRRSTQILESFISRISNNYSVRIIQRDTVKIENNYGFLFGFGVVTNFLKEVYEGGGNKGMVSNIRAIGITFGDVFTSMMNRSDEELALLNNMEASINIDGYKVPLKKINTVLGGTVQNIGMGFSTLYRANDIPGKFHVIINAMSPVELVMEINKIRFGQRIESPYNYDETVSEMIVESDGFIEYTMDGDLYKTENQLIIESGEPIKFVII